MFALQKHIAQKWLLTIIMSCKCLYKTDQIQNKMTKTKNCTILGSETPKKDLLTLNKVFPSSFNTLSTKTSFVPLIILDAHWALTVYPVLKKSKSLENV